MIPEPRRAQKPFSIDLREMPYPKKSVKKINVSTVIVSDHQFSDQNKRDLLKFVRNQKGPKATGAGVTGDVEPLNP
jgi:hypothetical protein